jgi:hypothetical protein
MTYIGVSLIHWLGPFKHVEIRYFSHGNIGLDGIMLGNNLAMTSQVNTSNIKERPIQASGSATLSDRTQCS